MKEYKIKLLATAISLLPSLYVSAYDFAVDGMYFNIISLENLTCTITYGDEKYIGDIVIPEQVTYNGRTLAINEIDNSAFKDCDALTSVIIPSSITAMGSSAFENCTSLSNIDIPSSITAINDHTFSGCTSLTNITIPTSVTTIGEYAFSGCSALVNITLPESITTIDNYTFRDCITLENIVIPNSVTTIGNGAFYGCSSFTEVTIPNNVKNIGGGAWNECRKIKQVVIADGLDELPIDANTAFSYCPVEYLYIGRNVSWDDNDRHTPIQKVIIGSYVTDFSLGNLLITEVKNLVLQDSKEPLEQSNYPVGFQYCKSSLETLYYGRYLSGYTIDWDRTIKNLTDLTIGIYISYIGSGSGFNLCENLSAINLTNATPPTITGDSFTDKQYINTIVTVPTGSLSAYQSAEGWKNFWNITESDELIKSFEVDGLKYIIESDTEVSVIKKDEPYEGEIVVPANVSFASKEYNVIGINDAFSSSPNLLKITIISPLTTIGQAAFKDDIELQQVILPEGINQIPVSTFENCTSLKDITLPQSITIIGDNAFNGCSALTSIMLADNLTQIGTSAFENCTGLETIAFGENVVSIGESAFIGCTGLTAVNFNDNLPAIDKAVFMNCSGLTSIKFNDNLNAIGDFAFMNCSRLTSVEFNDNLTSIGKSAFMNCSGLTSAEFNDNLTSIGDSAFMNCSGLTSVEFNDNLTSIGESAFESCSSIEALSIPASVISFGENAFKNCNSLKELIIEDSNSPLVLPCIFYGQTAEEVTTVNDKRIRYRIRYYNGYFKNLPIEKLYIGRNLSDGKLWSIYGTDDYNGYVVTQYEVPFGNLPKLTELTIGENVSILGPQEELIHISELGMYLTLPGSFRYCDAITSVKVNANIPPTGAAFSSTAYTDATLIVPDNSIEDYKSATGWKDFYNIIGESESTGITDVTSAIEQNFRVENGSIIVENVKGFVYVYDITGRLIKSVNSDGNRTVIGMPQRGIYIVKAGNRSGKIAIR